MTAHGTSRNPRPPRSPEASPVWKRIFYAKLHIDSPTKRLKRGAAFFVALAVVLAGRVFQLQGIDAEANAIAAAERMTRTHTLAAQRGTITDRNGIVLAESQPAVIVIADPWTIETNGMDRELMDDDDRQKVANTAQRIATILVKHLGGSYETYLKQLTTYTRENGKPNQYEVLVRGVAAYDYEQLKKDLADNNLHGIYKEDDPIRSYPSGTIASNVVGFVNAEGVGSAGIEGYFDSELKGKEGLETYENSVYGKIPLGTNELIPAQDGMNYQLTLDSELQWMAQQEVATAVEKSSAETGTAIVMNIKTGEVLAMVNVPTFDSNSYNDSELDDLGNRAVMASYEPGSVQKVLTMAALVDAGLATPDTRVEVPKELPSGGSTISDAFDHNTIGLTARGIIANSSNIGIALLTRQMNKETLVNYLKSFGLGQPTNIELPGEGSSTLGIIPQADMPDYTRDQIAFGQGLSVTALQEAAAVAAIVNDGIYHQPTIISSVTDASGRAQEVARANPRRVISSEASDMVLNMMESVIASPSFVKTRAIPGYRMAGKSGTAQRVDPDSGGYRGYTASFVGVAPVEDPQILVYVVIDNPQQGSAGSALALPPVQEIMKMALPRYGIAPSETIPVYKDPLTY